MASGYKSKRGCKTYYRHSTTFYRKLNVLKFESDSTTIVKQHFGVVKPLQATIKNIVQTEAFLIIPSTEQTDQSTDHHFEIEEHSNSVLFNEFSVPEDNISLYARTLQTKPLIKLLRLKFQMELVSSNGNFEEVICTNWNCTATLKLRYSSTRYYVVYIILE